MHDLENLLALAGFEHLRSWAELALPLPILPFRWLALSNFLFARRQGEATIETPLVSVVIAARNEEGHVDELLERLPEMGRGTEGVFVEGGSSNRTYEVIEQAIAKNLQRKCSGRRPEWLTLS